MANHSWVLAAWRAYFLVLGSLLLFLVAVGYRDSRRPEEWDVSDLDQIKEPIRFVQGTTSNHDASWTIEVRDANQRRSVFCIRNGGDELVEIDPATHIEKTRFLMSGYGERRLLDILERWAASDPEADALRRQELIGWESEGKAVAILMIRALRRRN